MSNRWSDNPNHEISRRQFLERALAAVVAVQVGATWNPFSYASAQGTDGGILLSVDEVVDRLAPVFSDCPVSTAAMLDRLRLLDARGIDEFTGGHLPTAAPVGHDVTSAERNGVPGMVATPDQVADVFGAAGIHRDLELILYSDRGNLWSGWLYWLLDHYGHRNVRVMDGGLAAWEAESLDLIEDTRQFERSTPELEVDGSKRVDVDWVMAHLGDPSVTFVDARLIESYDEGHIPGAVSAPWRGNIDWNTERFLPAMELLTRYRDVGVSSRNTVVTYCQLGVLGSHDYLALKILGYPDVRLYDGSFAEWSSDPSRPVET